MRTVTRQVAFEPAGWTPERVGKVAQLFDNLAPEWHTRFHDGRADPLVDALDRGAVNGKECLEIGCGTGFSTALLCSRFGHVCAIDLSRAMLTRIPAGAASLIQSDSSMLPFRDQSADVVILENMLLFPAEMERVLVASGSLVWVSSLGDRTPIYLSAEDVLRALPGRWEGIASEAGWGTWCVARRR